VKIKIAEVGSFWGHKTINSISFFSNDYFIDSAILVVKLSSLKRQIMDLIEFDGTLVDQDDIQKINFWVQRRGEQIDEFYINGGVVAIISDDTPVISFRKDRYLLMYHSIDLIEIFSKDSSLQYEPHEGSFGIGSSYVAKLSTFFDIKFHFLFKNISENYKVLYTTQKSKKAMSVSTRINEGLLVILPHLINNQEDHHEPSDEDDHTILNVFLEFINDQKSKESDILTNIPEWLDKIKFSKIDDNRRSLRKLKQQQELLEKQIKVIENVLVKYAYLRSVIYTKGADLELGIRKCFEHLEINFEVPEGSETDLLIVENHEYFPIEIKGGVGSASKQHVRQLEDWSNMCAKKYNIEDTKPILIINTFQETPIDQRNQIDFPPNVVEFSKARNHCLLTTKTFLSIISDFDGGLLNKIDILDLLKNTSGVLIYRSKKK
jgi:hypothetical protein